MFGQGFASTTLQVLLLHVLPSKKAGARPALSTTKQTTHDERIETRQMHMHAWLTRESSMAGEERLCRAVAGGGCIVNNPCCRSNSTAPRMYVGKSCLSTKSKKQTQPQKFKKVACFLGTNAVRLEPLGGGGAACCITTGVDKRQYPLIGIRGSRVSQKTRISPWKGGKERRV